MDMIEQIKSLVKILNEYTDAYEKGTPLVSDQVWDEMYFTLQEAENLTGFYLPESPTQHIRYETVDNLKKIKHNHPMLNAAKTKDWNEFLNYFSNVDSSKDVIGMLKLDGLTLSLRYVEGKLVSAETRGNGEIGEDVLHNAMVIRSIPKKIAYKDELIIDGEIICTNKDFEPFSEEYKNSRNFASGSIRLLDAKECASRNLTFVAWYIEKGLNFNSLIDKFRELAIMGFKIVPFTSSFDYNAKDFLLNKAEELGYPIDGLIGRFDDIDFGKSLGSTSHHRKDLFAFKMYDEEYETTLIDISYNVSRNGEMVPVAIVKPVEIGNTIVSRCSLHNLSVLEDLTGGIMREGDHLWITKRNQIIPNCERWETTLEENNVIDYPKVCPYCGEPTSIHISETGVKQLFCDNKNCDSRLTNRIDHFCSKKGMDIKGLSGKTIEKLIDLQWLQSIEDIYSLKNFRQDWVKLAGFGPASVDKILNAIENSKTTELWKFISALGIPLIGMTAAKTLGKQYNSWKEFREDIDNSKFTFDFIDGFGSEMNYSLKKFDYSEADNIAEMLTFTATSEDILEKRAKDLTFCITGSVHIWGKRDDLKSYIESIGGRVVSSMSSKVNYLINNDSTSTTAKNNKAKELGIPILTEEGFIENFGKNI